MCISGFDAQLALASNNESKDNWRGSLSSGNKVLFCELSFLIVVPSCCSPTESNAGIEARRKLFGDIIVSRVADALKLLPNLFRLPLYNIDVS